LVKPLKTELIPVRFDASTRRGQVVVVVVVVIVVIVVVDVVVIDVVLGVFVKNVVIVQRN
jgi:hypothetical protein